MKKINYLSEESGDDARTSAASLDDARKLAGELRQSIADLQITSEKEVEPIQLSRARIAADRASING